MDFREQLTEQINYLESVLAKNIDPLTRLKLVRSTAVHIKDLLKDALRPDSTVTILTMPRAKYLTLAEIAKRAGIGYTSIRVYHTRAEANRAANNPRPGDLPEPDIVLGITPGWSERTIDKWLATRPRASKRL